MKLKPICCILLLLVACNNYSKHPEHTSGETWIYDLSNPDRTLILSNELEEISDLAMLDNGNLACVQDENGILYELDPETGTIISKTNFAEKGDFEALAVTAKDAYGITSKGNIYEVENFRAPDRKVIRYATFLDEANNVEGACFDPHAGSILLVCKDSPGAEIDRREYKAVYTFSVSTHKLSPEPLFKIPLKKLKGMSESNGSGKKGFHPSGIALHPISKHFFVVASAGKKLVELDEKFQLIHVSNLPEEIFAQPEGITFDKEGGMYISNEGKGAKANIHYFEMKK